MLETKRFPHLRRGDRHLRGASLRGGDSHPNPQLGRQQPAHMRPQASREDRLQTRATGIRHGPFWAQVVPTFAMSGSQAGCIQQSTKRTRFLPCYGGDRSQPLDNSCVSGSVAVRLANCRYPFARNSHAGHTPQPRPHSWILPTSPW